MADITQIQVGSTTYDIKDANATSTSVFPNDDNFRKTKYRVAKKDYTGSDNTAWYYPLVKFPKSDASNYASLIVSGRLGGWVNTNLSYYQALIWNREGAGIASIDISGGATSENSYFHYGDLVIYKDSTTEEETIYIKCQSYFVFDLDLELYQYGASIIYDGTKLTTTPSGTLTAQASTTTKRLALCNGKLLMAGTDIDSKYAGTSHNHSASDITSGTLSADRGGTGQTTLKNAGSAIINALDVGTSNSNRDDYIVTQFAGGGESTTSYHRRKLGNVFGALSSFDITRALSFTPVNKAGDTMTGELKTSFNSSVAIGSMQAASKTVDGLCEELRYSSGAVGSVVIETDYTKDGVTVSSKWYNFIWIPHRSGGANGSASGDNCNYGTLLLTGMTGTGFYLIRYTNQTISELKDLYADTKVTNTLATTTKYYVTGTTSNVTNTGGQSFDTGIYATTTAGQLNATTYKVNEHVTMQWNSTDESLDFVFA